MAMPATTRWTAEMVRALPDDGKRYEVIDGELFVTPSPTLRHQDAVFEMSRPPRRLSQGARRRLCRRIPCRCHVPGREPHPA